MLCGLLLRNAHFETPDQNFDQEQKSSKLDEANRQESDAEMLAMRCQLFRVLRVMYSNPRNRASMKSIFPPQLFGQFVDIGNFIMDISKYVQLTNAFDQLGHADLHCLRSFVTAGGAPAPEFVVQIGPEGYKILETLGRGAFGVVYLVQKPGSTEYFALKQIPIDQDSSLSPAQKKERARRLCEEVEILSQLNHSCIVRCHFCITCFRLSSLA